MRIKLGWTNYCDEIAGNRFRNSVSIDVIGRAEADRLRGMGIPLEEITEEEAERILALKEDEHVAEERKAREAREKATVLQAAKEIKEAEEAEVIKAEAIAKAQYDLEVRRKADAAELGDNDLKSFLESLPEAARAIYPDLASAKESLASLIDAKAKPKEIKLGEKKVDEWQSKFEDARKVAK